MVGCWDCDNEPDFTAQRREWARELQDVHLKLTRVVDLEGVCETKHTDLVLEKLKRIQNEIYDLSEGQGK